MLSEVRAQLVDEGVLAILTSNAARASASGTPSASAAAASAAGYGYGHYSQWDTPGGGGGGGGEAEEPGVAAPPSAASAEGTAANAVISLATSYMRIWLSLREIEFKDPHPKVARAIGAVVGYVHAQVQRASLMYLLCLIFDVIYMLMLCLEFRSGSTTLQRAVYDTLLRLCRTKTRTPTGHFSRSRTLT